MAFVSEEENGSGNGDRKKIEVLIASALQTWPSKGGKSFRENGMFRHDNNGQTTLNRTILDRAIHYRVVLCDDFDLYVSVITF